jgi:L-lactate utilization protein LutB
VNKFFTSPPPLILSNNKSAINISSKCSTCKEHCQVNQQFHIINELLLHKKVCLEWVPTNQQMANILTKALGWLKVVLFLEEMGLKTASQMLASIGGKVCSGCNEHTPPAIVLLPPRRIASPC